MTKLGITGQIATGKSTAAREFAKFGGKIIFADEIGREVVEGRPPILSKLVRAFGPQIVTPQGILKRRELGRMAFSCRENIETLNRIVHPPLLQRLKEELELCAADPQCPMAIIDAALLIDWGWHKKMDWTVCVTASHESQVKRLREKGLSDEEIQVRIAIQKSQQELASACDFVIENDDTIEKLRAKVDAVYKKIISQSPSH